MKNTKIDIKEVKGKEFIPAVASLNTYDENEKGDISGFLGSLLKYRQCL